MARLLAERRLVAGGRELPGGGVDGEDRDAVVAAVRAVDELPVRTDRDLGGVGLRGKAGGDGRERLQFRGRTRRGVVRERRDRGLHLVDDVQVAPVGMEGGVTRPCPGREPGRPRLVGREAARGRVEPVDEHLVEAQVGDERESIRLVEAHPVRVGALLASRVRSMPLVLHERRGRAQAAVGLNGQHGDAAPAVVRDEDEAAPGIEREVARRAAAGGLLVQGRERIQVATARVQREERRAHGLGRRAGLGQRARREVESKAIDPLARAGAARVRADVDHHRPTCRRGRTGPRSEGGDRKNCQRGRDVSHSCAF